MGKENQSSHFSLGKTTRDQGDTFRNVLCDSKMLVCLPSVAQEQITGRREAGFLMWKFLALL